MGLKDWLGVYICVFIWWVVIRDSYRAYKLSVTKKYILTMKGNCSDVDFLVAVLALSEFSDNKKPSIRKMKKYIKAIKGN